MKRALMYSAGLIAFYLLVANATAAGRLIGASSTGGVGVIKAFQGRG